VGSVGTSQLGQLFPPDTDDSAAAGAPGPTRAELATTFRLRPETLAELLDNLRGVTVWTDDRGQLHGRPSRAR
jgi:hypothetical protein